MPGYCFAVAGQTATCLGRNGENLYVTQNEASSDTNRRMPMARPITQVEAEGYTELAHTVASVPGVLVVYSSRYFYG